MDKTTVNEILKSIDYYNNFKSNFLHTKYPPINYGSRVGKKEITSLFDAAQQYDYNGKIEEEQFLSWHKILNDTNSSAEELLCTILEIFDWGKVMVGNVKTVVQLYKSEKLKDYVGWINNSLKNNQIITTKDKWQGGDIHWSSGWTKVYSFINNDILIYDSRVSAFLNHTLTYKSNYNEQQLDDLQKLTSHLFNFEGAKDRERLIKDPQFRFRKSHPSGINGLNANLISSWIVQSVNKELKLNYKIRSFERAFFMLGFDLKQLTK